MSWAARGLTRSHEKSRPAPKNLPHMPTPFFVAKKMGAGLGKREVLF